jgi:NAD(P)-dependent dehydrogenase (short-subunit alcohol dehydrogenase family)
MATYLVTGANRGIGYEYCKQIQARGDKAIALCRHSSQALDELSQRTGMRIETGIDISDDSAISSLVQSLQQQPIDVLINNAGIYRQSRLDDLNIDGIREQFEINAIAPLKLTQALLPNLRQSAHSTDAKSADAKSADVNSKGAPKIAMMTSRMGSIGDNTSGGSYGYRLSKVAVSMAGKSLAYDLKPQGIAVAILHPGLVSTDMTNFTSSGISPADSVKGLLARIDELTLETTGTFWHANGDVLPW